MAVAWGLKSLTVKAQNPSWPGDHHWVVLPPVGRLSPSGVVAEPAFIPRRGLGGSLFRRGLCGRQGFNLAMATE